MARLIRASEVGEYVFCHRAWWLRVVAGLTPDSRERMARGIRLHRAHGRRVALSHVLLLAGLVVLIASLARLVL